MLKRNSIFVRIIIPVISVMLLQTAIIGVVLSANGTVGVLDESVIKSLDKNTENRRLTLEDMMINHWANLDKLEMDLTSEIDDYLGRNGLTFQDVQKSGEHQEQLLDGMSDSMISALRISAATGIYVFLLDGEGYSEREHICHGLYYRDHDPVSTPADNSDILFLRGFIDTARKDNIQLDSLWSESFVFSPEYPEKWRDFANPQLAALSYPDAAAADLAYWNGPHQISPWSPIESNLRITYTRPLIYNGEIVAMIGADTQVSQLKKFFPAKDFDNYGKSGYVMLKYDKGDADNNLIDCTVMEITGSYINRMLGVGDKITLASTKKSGVYTIASNAIEDVHVTLQPISLYNNNAPFSNEQWALAAIGADSAIFGASRKLQQGIFISSVTALIIGCIVLSVLIRLVTKPLISLVWQIGNSGPLEPMILPDDVSYEVGLLKSTINAMRQRRSLDEAKLREERERYLIALESTSDTFLEYDISDDKLMLYYFSGEDSKSQLEVNIIDAFSQTLSQGEFCHPDDERAAALFMSAQNEGKIEIRVKTSVLSHISGVTADGGYYWIELKASLIRNDAGNVEKLIGTAREKTKSKLEKLARIETARRDPTTGFYNREYGLKEVRRRIKALTEGGNQFALCVVHLDDLDQLEAYYGRVFGAMVLLGLSREISVLLNEYDVAVRANNDDFLILACDDELPVLRAKAESVISAAKDLYVGDNPDMRLRATIGVSLCDDAKNAPDLLMNACKALRYAEKMGGGRLVFFDELPADQIDIDVAYRDKPVNVYLDVSKENTTGLAFELFERTSDIHSAIKILLCTLSETFDLSRIIVSAFDADFGTTQAAYQWADKGLPPYPTAIEKVDYEDMRDFEALLDENGTMIYNTQSSYLCSDGVKRILCLSALKNVNAYCCAMYENSIHTGRILFMSRHDDKEWTEMETLQLYELTKIIAAHLSIEKSNSASRAKSEFLSRVSHEIRTPMSAIIGMTEIAKGATDDERKLKDCLGKIDFSAKHLLSLINDVLEMSRIESGKLQISNGHFTLNGLIMGIDTLMRQPIEANNLTLTIDTRIKHDAVIGDEYRLRQVLVNLLGNANKFTRPGGSITFTVEELEDFTQIQRPPDNEDADFAGQYASYRFSVKDTGIGISPEFQPLVFKAFEQGAEDTRTNRQPGTGLGLAISGNIVTAMGGKIQLVSKVDEGSEFYFTLTLQLDESEQEHDSGDSSGVDYKYSFEGKRVLLVEDLDINIEIAKYILQDTGMIIDVAHNGQEAVDMFMSSKEEYYDIILMDIQMPIMDGLTATRNIRKNTARADARTVPIIAMTANAFDEDMKKSIESGMNGHLVKPIEQEAFFALLKQQIRTN